MAKKNKNKDKIIVSFLGGSATDTTGSCMKVSYYCEDTCSRQELLCDFGLIQGVSGDVETEYRLNKQMIDRIDLSTISHIFFSHPHLDHFMNLPLTSSREFNGRVILTDKMKSIGYNLLLDGVFIHNRNVDYLKSKKNKKYESFYTEGDVHIAMHKYVDTYPLNEIYRLNSNLSFRLLPNSHVIGAVIIELFIKKISGKVEKVVYYGDIGSKLNKQFQPFLEDTAQISKASLVCLESTYGSKERGFTKKDAINERRNLIKTIKKTVNARGKVIIPSFSFGRSQTLMHLLYQEFKDKDFDIPIIIDSRLTNEINNTYLKILEGEDREYWKEVLSWENFIFVKEYKDTEMLAYKKDYPCIVISSSGFVENGHIVTWIKANIENRNNTIVFCGYTGGDGTLGNRLSDTRYKSVKIEGLEYNKLAKIKQYKTFSSHTQQDELVSIVKGLNNSCRVCLHHGNMKYRKELKEVLQGELSKMNRTNKIHIVDKDSYEYTI